MGLDLQAAMRSGRKKKILSFLLICLVVLSCAMAGCSSGNNSAGATGDDAGADSGGTGDGGGTPAYTGTVYYVFNSGDDNQDGRSPDTAWETISRVNSETSFKAGDAILFKRDDVCEQLVITWSGEPGAPLIFGAYGSGDKPGILGSERAENWSAVNGHANIWQPG